MTAFGSRMREYARQAWWAANATLTRGKRLAAIGHAAIEITKRIIGDYVSRYDFKRSEEDGATVKLVYENRGESVYLRQEIPRDASG